MKDLIGIDQYGTTYHSLGKHPRKELMDRLGYSSARRMFVDRRDGTSRHVGYVVGPYWVTLYQIERWEGRAVHGPKHTVDGMGRILR